MTPDKDKLSVINLGIEVFYDALVSQGIKATQIQWHPPVKQEEEWEALLEEFL